MRERSRKRILEAMAKKKEDAAESAFRVFQEAIGEKPVTHPDDGKDPAAVALGRKGGLKGGKARAAKMTEDERKASAKKAAEARWAKKDQSS